MWVTFSLFWRRRINIKVVNISKRERERKIIDCNYRQVFDIKNYFGRLFLRRSRRRDVQHHSHGRCFCSLFPFIPLHVLCYVLSLFHFLFLLPFLHSRALRQQFLFNVLSLEWNLLSAYHYILCVSERKLAMHISWQWRGKMSQPTRESLKRLK